MFFILLMLPVSQRPEDSGYIKAQWNDPAQSCYLLCVIGLLHYTTIVWALMESVKISNMNLKCVCVFFKIMINDSIKVEYLYWTNYITAYRYGE